MLTGPDLVVELKKIRVYRSKSQKINFETITIYLSSICHSLYLIFSFLVPGRVRFNPSLLQWVPTPRFSRSTRLVREKPSNIDCEELPKTIQPSKNVHQFRPSCQTLPELELPLEIRQGRRRKQDSTKSQQSQSAIDIHEMQTNLLHSLRFGQKMR